MRLHMLMLAGVSVAALSSSALAFRSGPPAGFTGSTGDGATCRLCHGENAGTGSVQILGAPAKYRPNRTYTLTVRVADPVQLGGGFQLTVEDGLAQKVGSLFVVDPINTNYSEGGSTPEWIEHTETGVNNAVANWSANGNSASYTIEWMAPSSDIGPITFFAAGNAINNNFDITGDVIYLTNNTAQFDDCPADLDGDGSVGSSDLATLLGAWGSPGATDLDDDGATGASDLATLLGSWGGCP